MRIMGFSAVSLSFDTVIDPTNPGYKVFGMLTGIMLRYAMITCKMGISKIRQVSSTYYHIAKRKGKDTAASARRLGAQYAKLVLSPSPTPGSLTAATY
jgi:hypothetical protein